MWNLEKDPHLSASIANVTLFDVAPDPDRLRARLERAVAMVPRLRQRVVPALGRLAPPEWRDDPDFDLDYHLRWVALPAPGHDAPAPRPRRHARAEPVRPHPAAVGVRGDRGPRGRRRRDGPEAAPRHRRRRGQHPHVGAVHRPRPRRHRAHRPGPPGARRRSTTNLVETTVDTLTHQLRRGLGVARRTVEGGVGLAAATPRRLAALAEDVVELGRSALRQVAVVRPGPLAAVAGALAPPPDRGAPGAPRRRQARRQGARREPQRHLRGRRRRRRRRLPPGGGRPGRRAAHHDAGEHPHRRARPAATPSRPTRVLLPVGIEDPAERFDRHPRAPRHHQARAGHGRDRRAGRAGQPAARPRWRCALARQQVETVDFATSNVRGAPFPLFIAGARIVANYPSAPPAARRGTSR